MFECPSSAVSVNNGMQYLSLSITSWHPIQSPFDLCLYPQTSHRSLCISPLCSVSNNVYFLVTANGHQYFNSLSSFHPLFIPPNSCIIPISFEFHFEQPINYECAFISADMQMKWNSNSNALLSDSKRNEIYFCLV